MQRGNRAGAAGCAARLWSVLAGVSALGLLQLLSPGAGPAVGVTVPALAAAAVLGVPGAVLLAALQLLFALPAG